MSLNKINIVVAGATGYVGLDLIYILSRHLRANIKYLCAKKKIGKNINYFDKRIKKKLPKITKLESVNWSEINVLFTCLPVGESQVIIKSLIKYRNLKIIDLSADFRLNKESSYRKYYGSKHKSKYLLKSSIYSLTEFVKKKLKNIK